MNERPPCDIAALEQLLVRFSQLVSEQRWIKEIDINPLFASGDDLVALDARVILHDPKVLILDEPTLGLDIMTSAAILEFIARARERGHAIIFSTHYMSDAELLCDRVALIHRGLIMACATKQELYEATGCTNLHDVFLACVDQQGRTA